jgi:UDPglucose 6-dehydrogenase
MKDRITKIEIEKYEGYVYNLEVEPFHEKKDDQFYIDSDTGIVVHNCHPRDNIALSWLANKVDLSFNWYDNLMECREKQTEWLSTLILEEKSKNDLPIVILGKTFKKETNLILGSPSILLKNILEEIGSQVMMYDPWVDTDPFTLDTPSIFFIGTNHDIFLDYKFPEGSVVIDPWRYIKEQNNIKLIKIGDSK